MIKATVVGLFASALLIGAPALAQDQQGMQGQQGMQQGGQTQQGMQTQQGIQTQHQAGQVAFQSKAPRQLQQTMQQRTQQFQQAWNNNDFTQLGSFFTADATLLAVDGRTATGQNDIQQLLRQELTGPMQGTQSTFRLESIRTVTPQVAVIDVGQHISNLQQAGVPSDIHSVGVVVKQGNTWKIQSLRAFPAPSAQQAVGGAGQEGIGSPVNQGVNQGQNQQFGQPGQDQQNQQSPNSLDQNQQPVQTY